LSFKEKRELEALPARIEELETSVRSLHEAMADPAFYRKDKDEIAETRAKAERLESELASAFERWEALEAMGES
jgi:ATP-binding cassette subfamily F protein uup